MPQLLDDRIAQVLETLDHRLDEHMGVRDLAAAAQLSLSRFAQVFRQHEHDDARRAVAFNLPTTTEGFQN